MLSKEDILRINDLRVEVVDVPEWGGQVKIRELTAGQRDKFEQDNMQRIGKSYQVNLIDMRARLAALSIIDDNGNRMFNDSEIRRLSEKSAKALDRIFNACQRLNALGSNDDILKNSNTAQTDDSLSD